MQFINLVFVTLHLLEQKKDTILAGQFFTRASKYLATMVTCPQPGLYHAGLFFHHCFHVLQNRAFCCC